MNDPHTASTESNARRPVPRWRRITVGVLVALSVVLTPLAITAVWLRNEVLDTGTYVDTVRPLASNPAIIDAAATLITNELFSHVDVEREARDALPKRAEFLAGPLAGGLKTFTESTAKDLLETDQFRSIWASANRNAHHLVRSALLGGNSTVSTKDGRVTIDISKAAVQVRAKLRDQGVTIFDSVPLDQLSLKYELFDAKQLRTAQFAVRTLDRTRIALDVLVGACLAAGLLLSGDRRRTLIRWGSGLAAAMVLFLAALSLGRGIYLDNVTSSQLPRDTAAAVFDTLLRFYRDSLRLGFWIGIVVAAAALVSGPSYTAVRIRRTTLRLLGGVHDEVDRQGWEPAALGLWVGTHKAILRVGGLALACLLLVWVNHPHPATLFTSVAALLVYLALIEIVARTPARTRG